MLLPIGQSLLRLQRRAAHGALEGIADYEIWRLTVARCRLADCKRVPVGVAQLRLQVFADSADCDCLPDARLQLSADCPIVMPPALPSGVALGTSGFQRRSSWARLRSGKRRQRLLRRSSFGVRQARRSSCVYLYINTHRFEF